MHSCGMFALLTIMALYVSHAPCTCEVDVDWMQQTLTQHFSQARHHVTNANYKKQTMEFIRDQFRDMGLECHLDIFPTALDNVTGINVIGLLKGRHFNTDQDRVMGIGAHYDTMRNTPGVNDNGAAVVVMLQAARELASQPMKDYTIIFVAFDFEEWEYSDVPLVACRDISCGGRSLVERWLPNFFSVPARQSESSKTRDYQPRSKNWDNRSSHSRSSDSRSSDSRSSDSRSSDSRSSDSRDESSVSAPLGWKGLFVMDTIMNFNHTQGSQSILPGMAQVFPEQLHEIGADGARGDFLMLAGRQGDKALMDSFRWAWNNQSGQQQYEIESFTVPHTVPLSLEFERSDHLSFWMKNLSAIFITDTADYRGYMTTCYHNPCDSMDHVTPSMLQFAAKTCRTLISALKEMSSATSSGDRQMAPQSLVLILPMLVSLTLHSL